MSSTLDPSLLTQQGAQALNRGDFAGARAVFDALVQAGRAEPPALLGLALACRELGDGEGQMAAVDRLLARDPRHLRGLMMKADHLAGAGDARGATAFYRTVLKLAPKSGLPPDLAAEVARAQATSDRYAADYETHLKSSLSAQGLTEHSPEAARFAQSLDLMLGKKQIFLQEPRHYYFPGLPQIQFYGRDGFSWLDRLESATGAIRAELQALLADGPAFSPYVEARADRPDGDGQGMRGNPDWSALYLWKNGVEVPEVAGRCPATLAALEGLPFCRIEGRTPSILFSRLAPGARIPPHNGFINTRLIGHLPLIIPGRCGFRVGNETREWREGQAWLFDDTIQHEAWNDSDQDRIILIFDIWRPELTQAEQAMVAGLFAAVDAYQGGVEAWGV